MSIELLTNLVLEATPVAPKHVVTIEWIQNFFAGRIKMPVRLAASVNQVGTYVTATQTFTYTAAGAVSIDGVAVAAGDRVLLAGQTNAAYNGIFDVVNAGDGGPAILHRSDDFNAATKIFNGVSVAVNDGDTYDNRTFRLACDEPITLDTTQLNWTLVTTTTTGAQKFSEDFDVTTGTAIAGGGMEWDFDHSFGSDEVNCQIWNTDTKSLAMADIEATDPDTVTVRFDQAPAATKHYRIVIIG